MPARRHLTLMCCWMIVACLIAGCMPAGAAADSLDSSQTSAHEEGQASPWPCRHARPAAALPAFRIYISDARVGSAAMQALGLASARLATASCRALLSEFTDAAGRPLADKLTGLRMSAEVYLRLIVVVDGSRLRPCMGTVTLAFTTPGSRVVYHCGTSFATKLQHSPTEATNTIIHELLHSLGLGENPPSSEDISRRIRQLCW
jgi:hypothetical protein